MAIIKKRNGIHQVVKQVVKKIPKGEFLSYQEVAKLSGNIKLGRLVGNLMAKNRDPKIPCHRVIKNNNEIGGYQGSSKDFWKKTALLLKEGAIGVIPTDTIYGICGSALNIKTVEKIYKLRKRGLTRPMIILISCLDDLKIFGIELNSWQKKFLLKILPAKISVILDCPASKFSYLHRGTKALAFRIPAKEELLNILAISGPLIAPSANWEGFEPAKIIARAKRYFGNEVFYYNIGKLVSPASTLIDLTKKPIKIVRRGADYKKIERIKLIKPIIHTG